MIAALTLAAPLVGAAAKKSGSGSSTILILYAVIGGAFYFLFYRPRQRKAKEAREQKNDFDVGDEVLTAGGIVGYVIDIDDDRVTLETSVGASFVVLKQYVIRRLEEPVASESDDDSEFEDEDHEEYEEVDDHGEHSTEHDADSAGQIEETPVAEEAPVDKGRTSKRSRKPGNGDDPNGLDGPPII
jgi:preprotein translocase subunit YajC